MPSFKVSYNLYHYKFLCISLFLGYDALTCQKCGNAGECLNMADNGTPKVCDEGEACMFGSYPSSDLRQVYIRDCRPFNDSLPNCYIKTMHDVICFCQEDNCNKDDNCVCNRGPQVMLYSPLMIFISLFAKYFM